MFPTPQAMDGQIDTSRISPEARERQLHRGDLSSSRRKTTGTLSKDVEWELLPTPQASCAHGVDRNNVARGNPKRRLQDEIAIYPTPRGSEGGVGMCGGEGSRQMLVHLKEQGLITESERSAMQAGGGGQLNPPWVEWLMAFPLGWTALDASETPSSRRSRNTSANVSSTGTQSTL